MSTAIKRRRGTTAQHAAFTGLAAEMTVDTDKNTLVVHDGVTAGGRPLPTLAGVETLSNKTLILSGGLTESLSTVASTATPDIFAVTTCNQINYTGVTPTTGFGAAPQPGTKRLLICAGAAPFTASANMLIDNVPSGTTITMAAGDRMEVVAVTTTQFRLKPIFYTSTFWATPARATGTVYQNTSGRPKLVLICYYYATGSFNQAAFFVGVANPPSFALSDFGNNVGGAGTEMQYTPFTCIIWPGEYYKLAVAAGTVGIDYWSERDL